MKDPDTEVLREPTHFHPSSVFRKGGVVYRKTGPWTPAVQADAELRERVPQALARGSSRAMINSRCLSPSPSTASTSPTT